MEYGIGTWSDEVFDIFGVSKDGYTVSTENFKKAIHPEDLLSFLSEMPLNPQRGAR